MSIKTTALKYGWYIVFGAVLTGAGIFTSDYAGKYIFQRDAMQVILGTVERCYATQITTNPTYSVSPPSFVRSWVSTNDLTGTNFAWVTKQVTNTISGYTDRSMMVDLDAKIFALIPYYVDTNTVFSGTTNIYMLTVTGLFASLQIGDHTNQFTATPCWTNNAGTTNATTNAATFGPWAWRNYVVAWQERYKVLNALKMTKGTRSRSYNGSEDYLPTSEQGIMDLWGQKYSNLVTHVVSRIAYGGRSFLEAYILGFENQYYYSSYYSNNVPTNNWVAIPPYGENMYKMSYAEFKSINDWWYFHHTATATESGDYIIPPWTLYPDGYISATNLTGLGAGSWISVVKEPYTGIGGPDTQVDRWNWKIGERVTYSTWEFFAQYPDQLVSNTYAIYLKPTLPAKQTNAIDWIAGGQANPQQWDITVSSPFAELSGKPTNVFFKLDSSFIVEDADKLTVEFGSDQFAPLTAATSQPDYPAAPTASSGYDNFDKNAGSIGTMKGSWLDPNDYFFVKTWHFNYCTNKYW